MPLKAENISNKCIALVIHTLLWSFIINSRAVSADVYKYTDSEGHVYYTDKPSHKRYKLIIRSRPIGYKQALTSLAKNKKKYTALITRAAQAQGLDAQLVHAVIHAESAYDTRAVSKSGAVGLMQLMPNTGKAYGAYNRTDPKQNIMAGTRYLKYLMTLFKQNLSLSLAAYNAGENTVNKYHNRIPPYRETQQYVKRVLRLYRDNNG